MRSKIGLAVAAASLLALAAAGPQGAAAKSPLEEAAKPKKQCFWAHQATNFASSDDRFVQVRVGVKDVYQFEMFGHCTDVDYTQRIALATRGDDNRICEGIDADLITPSPIGPQRCLVKNIHKLTPEQVAALPRRARP
jgi:hypothetical protein